MPKWMNVSLRTSLVVVWFLGFVGWLGFLRESWENWKKKNPGWGGDMESFTCMLHLLSIKNLVKKPIDKNEFQCGNVQQPN